MRRQHLSSMLSVVLLLLSANVKAQSASGSDRSRTEVLISKLSPPVYPRSAQVAHITGDVDLTLQIRRDGSVESVVPVSGPEMLKPAAIDSAQHSEFECVNCSEGVTSYTMRYRFKIAPRDPEKACEANGDAQPPPVETDLSRHLITVFAWEIWTCDPVTAKTFVRARSAKCLYLWRCGRRAVDLL
jgi:hypothetical protein